MLRRVSCILTPHFDVVAAVSDGKAALDAAAWTAAEVVLRDIVMLSSMDSGPPESCGRNSRMPK